MIADQTVTCPDRAAAPPLSSGWRQRLCSPLGISLLLALATLAVYWPVARHGYVNYDDSDYASAIPTSRAA